MITRIVITRASVPRLVAIANAIAIEGNENRHLASSSSSSSSSRVPCPSPASVNSHCHRNPTQSRIPKTHYPRPSSSSSSSSSSSWPRMTRAQPTHEAPRGRMYIRTFDELRSIAIAHPCGCIDVHVRTRVRIHRTFMYVYTCFLYPSDCTTARPRAPSHVRAFAVRSRHGCIHQSRPARTHGTPQPRTTPGDAPPFGGRGVYFFYFRARSRYRLGGPGAVTTTT